MHGATAIRKWNAGYPVCKADRNPHLPSTRLNIPSSQGKPVFYDIAGNHELRVSSLSFPPPSLQPQFHPQAMVCLPDTK